MNGSVLLVSIAYSPNVGGIETHFDDLTKALNRRNWKAKVLTYQPLVSDKSAPFIERHGSLVIYRIPILKGLFYKLIKNPVLEFLYLSPGLFVFLPIIILNNPSISVIHSHGLVAGFVCVFWGRIFRKKVITTTHSYYGFPEFGMYKKLAAWIFKSSDHVLCLSNQSVREISALGVENNKITRFTYWIDLNKFKEVKEAKKILNLERKFIILFVGRLVPEKGVKVLLRSLKQLGSGFKLLIAGVGPLESDIKEFEKENKEKIKYLGNLSQSELPLYYSAADILVVPSTHEEGFGRVILESLACGTPVVASKRGAIPEAIDNSVGLLVDVNSTNLGKVFLNLSKNRNKLEKMSSSARKFAVSRYSEKNVEKIIQCYAK